MTQELPPNQPSDEPVIFLSPSGERLVAKANPDNITVLTDKLPDGVLPWESPHSDSDNTSDSVSVVTVES